MTIDSSATHGVHMFTRSLTQRVLSSPLVDLLTGPHGIDRYTEQVAPTWTLREARAKVVEVRRITPRSVTLILAPNAAFSGRTIKAGQYINLTVDIDGRRHTRCYSPANAEGAANIELTIARHHGGVVSSFLYDTARPGMVVGLSGVGGDFVLPDRRPRRILFISGGSGITPVMAMLRTLIAEGHDGDLAFVHYARTPADASYRDDLGAMPQVRVLHGYTRSGAGDLSGRFGPQHLAAAMPSPDAVFVCGPSPLISAVREHCPDARSESFVAPTVEVPARPSGGRVTFARSGIDVVDDGRPLLEQAEAAGLAPQSGCRMGICHTCTRRKTNGVVRNLTTGGVSTNPDEDVQICVSVPVGDVELTL